MKSLIILTQRVLQELGDLVCTNTTRDFQTVASRSKDEGFSFLTITLPTFAKAFEECLDQGFLLPSLFPSFKTGKGGYLPAFLQGFTELVFDRCTGEILDSPSTTAVYCIRQLCYLFQKIELPASEARVRAAFQGYVDCEEDVRAYEAGKGSLKSSTYTLGRTFLRLYGDILGHLDYIFYNLDDSITPKHGPGSTADSLGSNERWNLPYWTTRLESVLPHWFMCLPNERWAESSYRVTSFLDPGAEPPVRVITVPKTLKTPRIIAMEPAHMQYVQQAIKDLLVPLLETSPLFGGMIGFSDQVPNQELALQGSLRGHLATLDLSEASDRVSNQLVIDLFSPWPTLLECIQACRSTHADVPGHGILSLSKFASMGSALTFPIEAMIFFAIIIDSIVGQESLPVFQSRVKALSGMVRVYGDDLIVPCTQVPSVIHSLQDFGFKVNQGKSFWSGRFRESCGKDYFMGEDVSVIRFRQNWPQSHDHAKEIAALVSFRNQMYWHGMWQTAKYIDKRLAAILYGHYPIVDSTSPALARESVIRPTLNESGGIQTRTNPHLQRPEVRAWRMKVVSPIDSIDDLAALRKCLIRNLDAFDYQVHTEPEHLQRAGRPKSVKIQLGWTEII